MNRFWSFLGVFCITLGHSSAFADKGSVNRDMLMNASLVAGVKLPSCVLNIQNSNQSTEFRDAIPKFVFRAMQLRSEIRQIATHSQESDILEDVADSIGSELQEACYEELPSSGIREKNRDGTEILTLSEQEGHLIGVRPDFLAHLDDFNADGVIIHAYLGLSNAKPEVFEMTSITMQALARSRTHPINK
jgi:hypothetical protein